MDDSHPIRLLTEISGLLWNIMNFKLIVKKKITSYNQEEANLILLIFF